MRPYLPILLASFLLVVFGTGCEQPTPTPPSRVDRFMTQVESLFVQYPVPGLSIGIMEKDSVLLLDGLGWADLENKVPMTGDTPLRIASLTKPIFSTVFAHLADEKKVDYQWRIRDYYPDYLGSCQRILGYFEAEMPEYAYLLNEYQPEREDILLVHHLSHTAEGTPGTHYQYNGFLYGMLSDVVQSATGRSFDFWVDSLVIGPLDLRNSAPSQLDSSRTEVLNRIALPYQMDSAGEWKKMPFPDMELNAGAGLVFSARDLLQFDRALSQNTLIAQDSRERMMTPYLLADGSRSPYGLGWFVQPYQDLTLVWHYGLQPEAYSGLYLKILELDLTLVLLANGQHLSEPFHLEKGNVLSSAFAKAFVTVFAQPDTSPQP